MDYTGRNSPQAFWEGIVMKKFVGFMMIAVLPMLCVVHIFFLMLCVPIIVAYSAMHQTVKCVKELFDLRNTYQFAKGIANQAWKMMGKE